MYFHQTVLQKFTIPYTVSPIGPIVIYFAYKEPVAPNRTPNQYGGDLCNEIILFDFVIFHSILFSIQFCGPIDKILAV